MSSTKGKAIDQPAPQDDHVASVRDVVARLDKAHADETGALAQAIAAHDAALAAMETAKTKQRLDETKTKHAESARALEGARAALAAATLEATRKELSERSTPDALATEIAAHWRVFISAYAAIEQSAIEIGDALKRSHNASAALVALGEYQRPLDPLHTLLPALDWLASSKGVVIGDLDAVRPHGITATSLVSFLEAHGKAQAAPSHHLDAGRARLARLRATRTALEARELEEQDQKKKSTMALASYRPPSPTRPAGPVPTAPAPAALLVPSDASTARRSSAPSRRHDE